MAGKTWHQCCVVVGHGKPVVRRCSTHARIFGAASALAILSWGPLAAEGAPILPAGSLWQYTFCDPTADPTWNTTTGLGGACGWAEGNAPFSNVGGVDDFSFNNAGTYWPATSDDVAGPFHDDLWVRLALDLTGYDLSTVLWELGVDNGFKLFLNGVMLASDNQEGYTHRWEYSGTLPGAIPGLNVIALALEDHGVRTAFDMQITGDLVPVPEPGTMMLVGLGGLGLAARRKLRTR